MNHVLLSGTIAGRPRPMDDGTAIRFYLRAGHLPSAPDFPSGIVDVPCRVFDVSPEQREILLGRKHRNVRVEAAGRLEQIVADSGSRWNGSRNDRQHGRTLEMIIGQQGLLLERGK